VRGPARAQVAAENEREKEAARQRTAGRRRGSVSLRGVLRRRGSTDLYEGIDASFRPGRPMADVIQTATSGQVHLRATHCTRPPAGLVQR
jgi:hypothetical protein